MNKNQARTILLLSLAAFILCFLITNRVWFRLDLTRNKAYTISEVSRNLHREIADQVRITYFVSDKLRQNYPVPGEIADLINEYAAHSRGKIRFIQRDPAKAELVREIEQLGIFPQQIQVTERNEITLATVYTGILIEYLDREAVMPVVFSLDTLEYDLTSRIRALVRNVERDLGIVVGDAYRQFSGDFGFLQRELFTSGFRMRQINPDDEIPSTLQALIVLGGVEDLDEEQLHRIDRYILGGGNVLFAVDGIVVDTRGNLDARAAMDQGLLAMLANYGVVVRRAMVLDRTALNISFQSQGWLGTVHQTVRYPHWISVLGQAGNPEHPVTADFQGLDLFWASPLELNPPPGITAEILFTSTNNAWLQVNSFVTNPLQTQFFGEELEQTLGTRILGASLSGVFSSAFESPPLTSDGRQNPSRLIIVGDMEFASNFMQINRGEGRNLDFLIKAVEWLSNDEDIVAIRGREGPLGRLDRISDPERRDAAMAFSRVFNTVFMPIAVILAGLFICLRRKAKTAKEKGYPGDV